MLVEHGDAIGQAADVSRRGLEVPGDQAKQGVLPEPLTPPMAMRSGPRTSNDSGPNSRRGAVRHHHIAEGDEFAAAGQGRLRQFDRKRRRISRPAPGLLSRASARPPIRRSARMTLAGAAVLGVLLLGVEHNSGLAAFDKRRASRPCRGALSSRRPPEPRVPRCAGRRKPDQEVNSGAGARGIAGFGKRQPGPAEDGDADWRSVR